MTTSIIAENNMDYIGRHLTQENNEQGFQQGLGFYP